MNSLTNFMCVLICCSSLSVNFVDPPSPICLLHRFGLFVSGELSRTSFSSMQTPFCPPFLSTASCLKEGGLFKIHRRTGIGQLGLFSRPSWELTPDQRSTPGLLWYLCSRHHLIGGFTRSLHSPSSVLIIPANDSESFSSTPI